MLLYCIESSVPFVGRIPYDKRASAAINAGHSIASVDCPAREALKSVCRHVVTLIGGLEHDFESQSFDGKHARQT